MKEYKRTSKWLIVLLVILSVIFMYGIPIGLGIWVSLNDTTNYEERDGQININKGDLVINNINSYYDSEDDAFYIEGFLKNNKDRVYEYVSVTFYVYDKDNNVLGEATAYLSMLEGNKTWKFKAGYFENDSEEVASYKFSSVEVY